MNRLLLTTTEARTRVKAEINLRYAEVCSGVGLAKTRRAVVTKATVANTAALSFTNTANLFSLYDAVNLKRTLEEISLATYRELDTAAAQVGYPHSYAILSHGATSMSLLLYPKPSTVYNLTGDILAIGTDLTADSDEPSFPEDFHDILVQGALQDELLKMEKSQPLALQAERRFEKRLGELRYYYAKRSYLNRQSTDRYTEAGLRPRAWTAMVTA